MKREWMETVEGGGCARNIRTEQEKEEGGQLKKVKKGSTNRKIKERRIQQGYTREARETHIDTETRTTGNKSGACVSGHTITSRLVAVVQYFVNQFTTCNANN